jgi:hypothetical protein
MTKRQGFFVQLQRKMEEPIKQAFDILISNLTMFGSVKLRKYLFKKRLGLSFDTDNDTKPQNLKYLVIELP